MRETHWNKNAPKFPLVWVAKAQQKAWELHNLEPHFWTPVRLASLFKVPLEQMRGCLWEHKLLSEAKEVAPEDIESGLVSTDYEIENGLGDIFSEGTYPGGFEGLAKGDIPIRKIHNPWYFVNPGLKSG